MLLFTEIDKNPLIEYKTKNIKYLLIKNITSLNSIYKGISITSGLSLFGTLLFYNKNLIDPSIYESLINKLNNTLKNNFTSKNNYSIDYFEFINGYCGVANYLRIISNKNELSDIINASLSLFDKNNLTQEYKWLTSSNLPHIFPNGYYNLGLSHGISGIIGLLGLTLKNMDYDSQKKVKHTIEFILNLRTPNGWPAKIYKSNIFRNNYPASWCYGFTGISTSLFNFYTMTNDVILQKEIKTLYMTFIKNSSYEKLISNTIICHGSGGILLGLKKFDNKQLWSKELSEKIINSIITDIKIDDELINKNLSFLDGEISKILSLNSFITDDITITDKILLFY